MTLARPLSILRVLAALALLLPAHSAPAENILIVADIHFDPFVQYEQSGDMRAIRAMAADDNVANWHFAPVPAATYEQETNSESLHRALGEIHKQAVAHNVRRVFVCGDLLEHGFRSDFDKYVRLKGREGVFSSNVILYLLRELRAATNNSPVDFTLGNNDTNTVHYEFPTQGFLDNLAGSLFDSDEETSRDTFTELGYSNVALNPSLNVICVNGNLLSGAKPLAELARKQLLHLRRDLERCDKKGGHAIVLIHEAFGIKAYKSYLAGEAEPLLDPALQDEYLHVLSEHSACISALYAGHFHREFFQSIGGKIPLIGTVALNSLTGNNPGFKIISIDDHTGRLLDYTTYFQNLSLPGQPWRVLYRFRSTYDRDHRAAADVIDNFPSGFDDPLVRKYRLLYAAESPLPHPIDDKAIWPYFYASMKYFDAGSFIRCLKTEFPGTRVPEAAR